MQQNAKKSLGGSANSVGQGGQNGNIKSFFSARGQNQNQRTGMKDNNQMNSLGDPVSSPYKQGPHPGSSGGIGMNTGG